MIDRKIIPLALGGLAVGTTEFGIMGLLPNIAQSTDVSIAIAGHYISSYALGVVVGAPVLIAIGIKFAPKKVLIFLMLIYAIFNGLSALTNDYWNMLFLRFCAGLPHGAFFGIGAVVASNLAPLGKQARFIAMMFTGLTLANLIFVPAITFIGNAFSWRWYFACVSLLSIICLLCVWLKLPDITQSKNKKVSFAFLKSGPVWFILAITAIGCAGLFAWFSYINPLMTKSAGFNHNMLSWIMVIAGAGMLVGNLLGGILSDKLGPAKTTSILIFAMMLSLLAVFIWAHSQIAMIILTFICGALSMATASPLSMMMIKSAPGSEMMGNAFMQGAFNAANSMGAFLGGLPLLYGYSYEYPSLVGAFMCLAGFIICMLFIMRHLNHKLNWPYIKNSWRFPPKS